MSEEKPGSDGEKPNEEKPRIVIKPVNVGGILNRYRLFFTVAIAYAVAFAIVYFLIPRLMYLWWGASANTAVGYYMMFAVPLMMTAPLLLIAIGLIVHVAYEVTDPIMNAVRQVAVRKLTEDKRYNERIEKIAENYLEKHLEKYGIIRVVKPGVKDRVIMVFKRGSHHEAIVI